MLSVRMRLVLLIISTIIVDVRAASIKKAINTDSTTKPEVPTKLSKVNSKPSTTSQRPIPAIVAIEIIDDKENSTSKTTSKRTIESALGYGYSNSQFGPEPPKKFVIYKYSQHDIPPWQHTASNGHVNVQNSIGYHLGSTSTHIQKEPSIQVSQPVYQAPATNQHYNQPTTLYTTFNHQGQLGGLSHQVPYQSIRHTGGMIPVIILRVYSNQLTSPDMALHTNLPQSHPYSGLNGINLQALLQEYVQQYLHANAHAYQQQLYESLQHAYTHVQPEEEEYHSSLPTSENYPSKHHTRVIFHSNNNGHIPESTKTTYTKAPGLPAYQTIPMVNYKTAQPNYVEVQTPSTQYAFASNSQYVEQPYAYVYPSQIGQDYYYQQEDEQSYVGGQTEKVAPAPVPPETSHEPTETPYNYHAHSHKQRRNKKNSSNSPSKKRELQLKTT